MGTSNLLHLLQVRIVVANKIRVGSICSDNILFNDTLNGSVEKLLFLASQIQSFSPFDLIIQRLILRNNNCTHT